MSDYFPFVIHGVAEEDIATVFFTWTADFDPRTLLNFRAVSKKWRDAVDSKTFISKISNWKFQTIQ